MNPMIDEVQVMLLQSAADFLAGAHSLERLRHLRLQETTFDANMWRTLAELGWVGMRLPESMGGAGLDVSHAAELAALFGAALLPAPFATAAVLPAALLTAAPACTVRDRFAAGFADGSLVLGVAWQEQFGQLKPAWGETRFIEGNGRIFLHGHKILVDSGAEIWLVSGVRGATPLVAAVAAGSAGVARTAQRMADGSVVLALTFDGVVVDREAILLQGQDAQDALSAGLNEARLVLAAQLAGMAQGALDLARTYIKERVQFGQTIASFQAIRHRFVDLDLQRRLAFASWRHAARQCGTPGAAVAISAAKARCSEAAVLIARSAVQLHGAMGYTEEANVGLFLRAALTSASALGNADVHRRSFAEQTFLEDLTA